MCLSQTFAPLLKVFTNTMTKPTATSFRTLLAGWLLAPRRTIIGMVRGSGTGRHHSAFHRVLARAKWSIDRVGLALFDLITADKKNQMVILAGDDTLIPRRGKKIFATGMHRDPQLSSRSHTVIRWGHCWVVLCVVIQSRRTPGQSFSLPVLARLHLNQKAVEKWRRVYRTKPELMIELLERLNRHASDKRLHFLGDSAYTAPAVLARIPAGIEVTGRAGQNTRMNEPPPPRRPGQMGRPRIRGSALPKPGELLDRKGLPRRTYPLYQGPVQNVRVAEQEGRFYKAPDRAVKVVAIEHLSGGRGREVFYTTITEADAETVLSNFACRWSIEVTFHDTKQHLGLGEPQNWTRPAAERTAATGLLLYSLVVWWHDRVRNTSAAWLRHWNGKRSASFADMLAALRLETLENYCETTFSTPENRPGVKKLLDHLINLFALAS